MSLLLAENVTGGYGETDILHSVSMRVEPGEIVAIIGPNGAGKSTAMKAVFGLITIRKGLIKFKSEVITGLRPDLVVRRGLCYVPQEHNVFPSLSVQENLEMGAFVRNDDISEEIGQVFDLFPPLKDKRKTPAGNLSGGQRQMVAMGRAMMLKPELLLLDEPSAGLSPLFIDLIFERIQEINKLGVGILMVEQNAKQALSFSDRGYILVMGCNRYEDTGKNLLGNKEVAEMFLGG
jgi:branched-chain amino acid transport system ATP-binding protein